MSGTATDVLREYLDFTKHQLEWEQRRNDRLEQALEEMRNEIKRTQEHLARLLPIVKPTRTERTEPTDTGGHGRTKKGTSRRTESRWKFGKKRK
jgi:cell division septum initiation protein DivIVA